MRGSAATPSARSTPRCSPGSTTGGGSCCERQAETLRRLQAESVLAWREYAFCLYPGADLARILVGATSQNGVKMV